MFVVTDFLQTYEKKNLEMVYNYVFFNKKQILL